ncbi:MAG: hypothetical protein R2762_18925 [Bryobacteraceae bacterium]
MKTGPEFEAFLARLYTDEALQRVFLEEDMAGAIRAGVSAGLTAEEARAVAEVDRAGLRRACESLARKRGRRGVG